MDDGVESMQALHKYDTADSVGDEKIVIETVENFGSNDVSDDEESSDENYRRKNNPLSNSQRVVNNQSVLSSSGKTSTDFLVGKDDFYMCEGLL